MLSMFAPEQAVAGSSPGGISLCICLLLSHRCVSLLVRVLGTGCAGRVGTIKDL